MDTREALLPKGVVIVDQFIGGETLLFSDVMNDTNTSSRFNNESKEYLRRMVIGFRRKHCNDYSCGKAVRVTSGSIAIYLPADLDEKCENYLARLLAASIKA